MNFKFGVLYAKEGQTSDDDMYNNGRSQVKGHRSKVNSYHKQFLILVAIHGH